MLPLPQAPRVDLPAARLVRDVYRRGLVRLPPDPLDGTADAAKSVRPARPVHHPHRVKRLDRQAVEVTAGGRMAPRPLPGQRQTDDHQQAGEHQQ